MFKYVAPSCFIMLVIPLSVFLSFYLYSDHVVVLCEEHKKVQKMFGVVLMNGGDFEVNFSDEKNSCLW